MKRKITMFLAAFVAVLLPLSGCTPTPAPGTAYTTYTVTVDGIAHSVIEGEKAPLPTVTDREGEVFLGWYAGNSVFNPDTLIAQDLTIVSKWRAHNPATDAFSPVLEIKAGNKTAVSNWTGSYAADRVIINITVADEVVHTGNQQSIGMDDNVEFIIQALPTDRWDAVHTLDFLCTADGSYWLKRAASATSWGESEDLKTVAVKGENFDFTFTQTANGYEVEVYFTYGLLNTTYEQIFGRALICPSMRNTNGTDTVWDYYKAGNALWEFPATYPSLLPNGKFQALPAAAPDLSGELMKSSAVHEDKELLPNLAKVLPQGTSGMLSVKSGEDLFTDLFHRFNYDRLPTDLRGLSFLYDKLSGSNGIVEKAGYVILAVPAQGYSALRFEIIKSGFVKIAANAYSISSVAPGGSNSGLVDYYVKWCAVGETIAYSRWYLALFAPAANESEYTEQSWLTSTADITFDFTGYETSTRAWQGVADMERTEGGRLYAGWTTGGASEPRPENYCPVVYSDDDGETWNDLFIIRSLDANSKINNVEFFRAPNGELFVIYCQSKSGNSFDGKSGAWMFKITNPDAPVSQLNMTEPYRAFDGLLWNNILVLSDGTWLAAPCTYDNDDFTMVYRSVDEGQTWTFSGQAYVPNARNFDETIIVEKNDGTVWMTVRSATGQILQSFSYDKGYTWTTASYTGIINPCARFQIVRLASGNLLMINNNSSSSRTHLTAFLSTDDGATWQYQMLLDIRSTSYPSVRQDADGRIFMVWDYDRYGIGGILVTHITEDEIKEGGALEPSRILVINSLKPVN